MTSLLPTSLVRVKDFMTYKVYDASEDGVWKLDENASGPDLTDMIMIWQRNTHAKISRAEPARAEPYRDGEARYRVLITTFVYYTPATEGTHDPTAENRDGPA